MTACYLYCIARTDLLPEPKAIETSGMEIEALENQRPVTINFLDFSDVSAVFSDILLEEFCGPSAEERMKDITWIGPQALRHELVIEEIMGYSPVLPVRFGTIFSSRSRLKWLIESHYHRISAFLDKTYDKEEWAIKGFVEKDSAKEQIMRLFFQKENERLSGLSPGKRYLEAKRLDSQAKKVQDAYLHELSKGLMVELSEHVSDIFERRLVMKDIHGENLVFNWAALVPKKKIAAFRSAVEGASSKYGNIGLRPDISGPWPPYSFTPALNTMDPETDL